MLSKQQIRQTAAELLGAAFLNLFPGAFLVKCEATECGFYSDFAVDQPIDVSFLPHLEEGMRALLKNSQEFRVLEMMCGNASHFFEHLQQPYLAERLSETSENVVSILQMGNFNDYFPHPYAIRKNDVGAFKLLNIEIYSGSQKLKNGPAIYRIHGIAGAKSLEVKQQLKALKRGWKQDHREIGKEMDLFYCDPELNPYEWFWRPNGSQLRHLLLEYWQKMHQQHGFFLVSSPSFFKGSFVRKVERAPLSSALIETAIGQEEYVYAPNAAYAHGVLFQSQVHAASELPVRYAECIKAAPAKKGGELWGILNARIVSTDYAHIFCTRDQLKTELISSLQFIVKIIKMFSFECYWIVKDPCLLKESIASKKVLSAHLSLQVYAQECLIEALQFNDQKWQLDRQDYFDAQKRASHASSQLMLIDSMGREWTGPSISVDCYTPERLKLHYKDQGEKKSVPYMICLSIYGSLERFTAVLIEHYGGNFPLWLMPEQGRVIPVHRLQESYAEQIAAELRGLGFRFNVDRKVNALNERIQEALRAKVPNLIIVGDKEEREKTLNVRIQEEVQQQMSLKDFLKQLQEELINERQIKRMLD